MPSYQSLVAVAVACCFLAALVGSSPIPLEGIYSVRFENAQISYLGSGEITEGSGENREGSGESVSAEFSEEAFSEAELLPVNGVKSSNDEKTTYAEGSGVESSGEGSGFEANALSQLEGSGIEETSGDHPFVEGSGAAIL
ncbi:hypothetical protein L596_004248 [Steinernema carpocapsae]|uniref:Uncharacterized protein n=1 Tax=Steinernema carpocapsae TaxID=34508 RepID=A0A4V6I8A3_STECR|nr:hypothetical protein L596_004248 [Steinernema carpocapsae]